MQANVWVAKFDYEIQNWRHLHLLQMPILGIFGKSLQMVQFFFQRSLFVADLVHVLGPVRGDLLTE